MLNAYFKKERLKISYLNIHLKKLEKEQQIKPKDGKWKKLIKKRTRINELERIHTIERINKAKQRFV